MERVLFSEWILPIHTDPIKDAFIAIEDGHIIELGQQKHFRGNVELVEDLGHTVLFPGLVNVLYHSDFGVKQSENTSKGNFINWLHEANRHSRSLTQAGQESNILSAIKGFVDSGTIAIGVRTTHLGIGTHLENSGLHSNVFLTIKGFSEYKAVDIWRNAEEKLSHRKNTSLTSYHASGEFLFSTSPKLLRIISKHGKLSAMPVGINHEEIVFFQSGIGSIQQFLLSRGDMDNRWIVPQKSIIEYYLSEGYPSENNILSHMISIREEDIQLLKNSPKTFHVCLHPRFNRQWEMGTAPAKKIKQSGLNICLGTFAGHVDMRREMQSASAEYGFSPEEVLIMATINGAKALNLDRYIGTLEAGKESKIIGITCKKPIQDPYQEIMFSTEKFHSI